MPKVLVIDDIRNFPSMTDAVYARTSQEGIEQITNHGPWDQIFWDHDLGMQDSDDDTTIKILSYLLWEHDANELINRVLPELKQTKHYIHTANPVGRDAIMNWLHDLECKNTRVVDALDLIKEIL